MRLTQLATARTQAEAALEAALLTDTERAEREAESHAHREALNTLVITHSADGQTLVAYRNHEDRLHDVPYPPADMPPVVRTAFDKARTAYEQAQAARRPAALSP